LNIVQEYSILEQAGGGHQEKERKYLNDFKILERRRFDFDYGTALPVNDLVVVVF